MKLILDTHLKKLIKSNDLTVAQLSRATKVATQTLNNWLAGLEPRSMQQVKKVADYFNLTIDELAYGQRPEKTKLTEYEDEINAGVFEVVLRRRK